MSFLNSLRLPFFPVKIIDPIFGQLTFMYIAPRPETSYWESEWKFPKTGTSVSIGLRGNESGPYLESREFFLCLPQRWAEILKQVKPLLSTVLQEWLDEELP